MVELLTHIKMNTRKENPGVPKSNVLKYSTY